MCRIVNSTHLTTVHCNMASISSKIWALLLCVLPERLPSSAMELRTSPNFIYTPNCPAGEKGEPIWFGFNAYTAFRVQAYVDCTS